MSRKNSECCCSWRTVFVLGALMTTLTLGLAQPAHADIDPGSCLNNQLGSQLQKDKATVENGDTINYTAIIGNPVGTPNLPCDITNALITLTLPAADGTSRVFSVTNL